MKIELLSRTQSMSINASTVQSNKNIYSFVLLIISTVLVFSLSAWSPNPYLDVICFSIFFYLIYFIYRVSALAFVLALPLIMYKISSFISFILISSGFEIPEVARFGEPSSAAASYLLVTVFFFLMIVFFVEVLSRSLFQETRRAFLNNAQGLDGRGFFVPASILCLTIVQIYILLSAGFSNGFPLLTGTDRFFYRTLNEGFYVQILNYKLISAMFAGFCFAAYRRNKAMLFLNFSLYMCLLVLYTLFGEKFNQLLLVSFVFSMPFMLFNASKIPNLIAKFSPVLIVVLAVAILLVYYIYSDYGRLGSFETSKRMFARMAQQSELWYVAVNDPYSFFSFDSRYFSNIVATTFSLSSAKQFYTLGMGPFYFIFKYAPESIIDSVVSLQGAVQYTQVSEALALQLFGVFGLILYLIFAALVYSLVLICIARSLYNRSILSIFLWVTFFTSVLSMINQAALHQVVGITTTKFALFALALDIFTLQFKKKRVEAISEVI